MKRIIMAALAFAMLSSALGLAVPSALASTAAPSAAAAYTPVGAAAVPNPHCTLSITPPHLVRRTAEVSATNRCESTVTDEVLVVSLFRNGHLVKRVTGRQGRGRGFTVTAAKPCRNRNRGSFTGLAEGQLRFRGHLFTAAARSGPVTLACGF